MKEKSGLNILSSFFYRYTNLRLIGLLLVLIGLIFLSLPAFEDFLHIDKNMISLDKPHLYSPERIYEILEEWGESGRLNQFRFHMTWDLLLPIVYFFFLGFLLSWLARRGFSRDSIMQNSNLVSLVALADLLENISLFFLIFIYPDKNTILCWVKTGLTVTKYYIFGPIILFALVITVLYAGKNKFTDPYTKREG